MRNISDLPSGIVPTLDPDNFPSEELFEWLIKPRNPVLATDDPRGRMFIEHMMTDEPVSFVYRGGSNPGAVRTINVSLVFQHECMGRIYVAGYCHESKANRVFALDLVMPSCIWN